MEIRQTSMSSYFDINADGTAESQRMTILHFIRRYADGLTRQEISRLLSIPINAVCGRIRELIKVGAIVESGKKRDEYSHKENYILKATVLKVYNQ